MGDAQRDHLVGRQVVVAPAFHHQVPFAGGDELGDRAQQRRLAGAVGPDHGHRLAGTHLERHPEQRLEAVVAGADVVQLEHRRRRGRGHQALPVRNLLLHLGGVGAEVDLDHLRVVRHLGRLALGDDFAVVQHDAAVDDAHQHAHDVLDPDDGDAALVADALEHVGSLVHLGLVQAAQALVGQQQRRLGGQRAGHLQLLQARRAHAIDAGLRVGGQADQLQCLARPLLGALARDALGRAVKGRQRGVLQHRELAKRPRDLEGAGQPAAADLVGRQAADRLAVERDRPGRRRVAGRPSR